MYDPERGFLLRFNNRWKQYAFIMKKTTPDDDPEALALIALDDDLSLKFPAASARPLDRVGAIGPSGWTAENTYYDYCVYRLDMGEQRSGSAKGSEAKFFTYGQLQASPEVSWSTKEIAKALVESREIVAAVVLRPSNRGHECLLVDDSPGYGYFFPSAGRRTQDPPDKIAALAVELDTGYTGIVEANWVNEVEFLQTSQRFGQRSVRFRCHVCRADLPGCDLNADSSPLSDALRTVEAREAAKERQFGSLGYWHWFPLEELGSAESVSPTVSAILSEVRRAADNP
jgi:hypothetical protein